MCTADLAGNLNCNLAKAVDGWRTETCRNISKRIRFGETVCIESNKDRNRRRKMTNGNG